MISRQAVALSTAAALTVAALAGCSSSAKTGAAAATQSATGAASSIAAQSAANASLSATALLAAFKQAAGQSTAVHVVGTMKQGTDNATIDIQLNKAAGTASGSITDNGATIPFRAVGGIIYVQFTPDVLKLSGASSDAATAAVLKNKWATSKSSVGSELASGFKDFASFDSFLTSVNGTSDGLFDFSSATAAGTDTVNGQSAAVYKDAGAAEAYFAASGPAYLLKVASTDSSSSSAVTLTWNQPTTVTAPPASQIYNG